MNIYKLKIQAVAYFGKVKGKEAEYVDTEERECTVGANSFDQAFKKATKAEFKDFSFIDEDAESKTHGKRLYWAYREFDLVSAERTATDIL